MFQRLAHDFINTQNMSGLYRMLSRETGKAGQDDLNAVKALVEKAKAEQPEEPVEESTALSLFQVSSGKEEFIRLCAGVLPGLDAGTAWDMAQAVKCLRAEPVTTDLLERAEDVEEKADAISDPILSGYGKKRALDALIFSYQHPAFSEAVRRMSGAVSGLEESTFQAVVSLCNEFPYL